MLNYKITDFKVEMIIYLLVCVTTNRFVIAADIIAHGVRLDKQLRKM